MKQCELCDLAARMYCESDQANLCWECDATVHSANFLVARHSRSLLCRSCQSPTSWRAEGARLGPTVSVCNRCVSSGGKNVKNPGGSAVAEDGVEMGGDDGRRDGDGEEDLQYEDIEEDDEDEREEEEEGDGENQVVPWTLTPPPPATSSSSEGEESGRNGNARFSKRMQETVYLSGSQDDLASSHRSCHGTAEAPALAWVGRNPEEEVASFGGVGSRPFKIRKRFVPFRAASTQLAASGASVIVDVRVHGDRRAVDLMPPALLALRSEESTHLDQTF